jgi:hypothetical protein
MRCNCTYNLHIQFVSVYQTQCISTDSYEVVFALLMAVQAGSSKIQIARIKGLSSPLLTSETMSSVHFQFVPMKGNGEADIVPILPL